MRDVSPETPRQQLSDSDTESNTFSHKKRSQLQIVFQMTTFTPGSESHTLFSSFTLERSTLHPSIYPTRFRFGSNILIYEPALVPLFYLHRQPLIQPETVLGYRCLCREGVGHPVLPSCDEGDLRRNLVQKQDEGDTSEQVEAGHGS